MRQSSDSGQPFQRSWIAAKRGNGDENCSEVQEEGVVLPAETRPTLSRVGKKRVARRRERGFLASVVGDATTYQGSLNTQNHGPAMRAMPSTIDLGLEGVTLGFGSHFIRMISLKHSKPCETSRRPLPNIMLLPAVSKTTRHRRETGVYDTRPSTRASNGIENGNLSEFHPRRTAKPRSSSRVDIARF